MTIFTTRRCRLAAVLLVTGLAAVVQAETVPLPEGFGVMPSKRLERLLYAEHKGELPNTVDRAALEQICRTSMSVGGATRLPVFEDGDGQPAQTRSQRYFSADGSRLAVYTEETGYGCPEVKSNGPCNCTYRRLTRRTVDVELWQGRQFKHWQADLDAGTGTLDEGSRTPPGSLPAADEGALTQLFGPVVGRGSVAGWACAQRELPGATAPRRTCLALPDPKLPRLLWGGALSSSAGGGADAGMRLSSELIRLVLDADVDSAVFKPPVSISYRPRHRAASKEPR